MRQKTEKWIQVSEGLIDRRLLYSVFGGNKELRARTLRHMGLEEILFMRQITRGLRKGVFEPEDKKVLDALILKNLDTFVPALRKVWAEEHPSIDDHVNFIHKCDREPLASIIKKAAKIKPGAWEPWSYRLVTKNKKERYSRFDDSLEIVEKYAKGYFCRKQYSDAFSSIVEDAVIRSNPSIIPTLKNNRGYDYFLPITKKGVFGVVRDYNIKKTRSIGDKFCEQYVKEIAADHNFPSKHPELIMQSLYINQTPENWEYSNRHFVEWPDDIQNIKKLIKNLENFWKHQPEPCRVEYPFTPPKSGKEAHFVNYAFFVPWDD